MADNAIRFLLDGQIHTVSGIDPNATVLNYLREHLRKTGTKEGCAEGDCGACTVVVGELHNERVRFRAINSCIQFLPTLDGKALFTVESLKSADGRLHPVQQAMVDCHGSQCGFCTPGFVMSLFALFRSEPRPTRPRICDALAGNLCRCTGYRPIIDAASRMYDAQTDDDWLRQPYAPAAPASDGEHALIASLKELAQNALFDYRAPAVTGQERRFYAPSDVAELAALVQRHPDARILAGGTDVGLWVTKGHVDLDTVIYLGNVDELKTVSENDEQIEIGAGATLTDAYETLERHYADLGEILRRYGSPPIRNAATIGGNIANGSPIGDSMPALIAIGATLVLRRGTVMRELSLEEFFLGYRKTALEAGEFVERIKIPKPGKRKFGGYKISKRFDQDISAVLGAFCLDLSAGTVRDIRICFGGMAATPKRAPQCEHYLKDRKWTEVSVAAAMNELDKDYAPITDMRASSDYRRVIARNLLYKFFLETSGERDATRVLARVG